MSVKIVDTTLRDGEQKAGIALGMEEKLQIAKIINSLQIYQIEAGIPAMGGEEKESIKKMVNLGLKSKISGWNRMNFGDIQHSIDCGVDIIHISVPCSDIQIFKKLKKDKAWVVNCMRKCIAFAKEKQFEVTVGLEDASRADMDYLIRLCRSAVSEGVSRVRYADTVGVLNPRKTFKHVVHFRESAKVEVEMHAHNDFGMAVANSLAAWKAGAEYIDCTFGGIGERAGNCDCVRFLTAVNELPNAKPKKIPLELLKEAEKEILTMMRLQK